MPDYSQMSDQDLLNLYKQKQQTGIGQIQPQRQGAAQLIGDFMTRLGGGEPKSASQDIQKLIQEQQVKQLFQDPTEKALREAKIKAYNAYAEADVPTVGTEGSDNAPYVRVGGKLVKNPAYKRQPTPEERSRELEDSVAQAELKDMAKALPKLDQASQAVKQLESLYGRAVEPKSVPQGDNVAGILNRLGGVTKSVAGFTGANPELNRYAADRKAFSGLLAKGGFGEAGMLTQQDIERISQILPSEYSTKEEAEIAWSEVSNILNSARQRFESKRQQYIQNPGSIGQTVDLEDEDQDPLGLL